MDFYTNLTNYNYIYPPSAIIIEVLGSLINWNNYCEIKFNYLI